MSNNNPVDEIRKKYIQNPPEGMTASAVKSMSDDDLLDMHYFLTEDDFDDEDEGEGFYIFQIYNRLLRTMPASVRAFLMTRFVRRTNFL